MRGVLAASLLAAGLSSCARHATPVAQSLPVFDTQVRNAVHMGDGDLEVQALRKRLLDSPKDVAIRKRLAAKFAALGYPDLALEHFRLAAEQAPADVDLQLELAGILEKQGLGHQALQVVQAALQHNPNAAETARAAILIDQAGSLTDGEALHRKAVALAPRHADYANNLAYNLIQQKRAAEAESILREVLRNKPTHERARNNLARLYATQLNQPEEALLHWKSISGPAAAHNNLAAVYMEQERWPEAKAELERALALRFQFPEALQNLHIVAARTGGTVSLNLDRDKRQSGLSKLAKAFRQVFIGEEVEGPKSKTRRSRS